MLYNSIVAPHLKTVVEDVLKCHNTSFEKKKAFKVFEISLQQSSIEFIFGENSHMLDRIN